MAPKAKLSTAGVVEQAVHVVDDFGYDALSISAVAKEMSVAPSALYTYCNDLDGLRNLVAITATNNLTSDVRTAATGTAGTTALIAMGDAYRSFTLDHPGQFASMLRPPTVGNFDLDAANQALLEIFVLVYSAMGLGDAKSQVAAKTTRSAVHGFLALEHNATDEASQHREYGELLGSLIDGFTQK